MQRGLRIDEEDFFFNAVKEEMKIDPFSLIKIGGRKRQLCVTNLFVPYNEDGQTRVFINFASTQINRFLIVNILKNPSPLMSILALKEYGVKLDLNNFFNSFRKNAEAIYNYMVENKKICKIGRKISKQKEDILLNFHNKKKQLVVYKLEVLLENEYDTAKICSFEVNEVKHKIAKGDYCKIDSYSELAHYAQPIIKAKTDAELRRDLIKKIQNNECLIIRNNTINNIKYPDIEQQVKHIEIEDPNDNIQW